MKLARRLALALLVGICTIFAFHTYLTIRWQIGLYRSDMQRDLQTMGRALRSATVATWQDQGKRRALELIEHADQREAMHIRWIEITANASGATASGQVLEPLNRGEEVVRVVERDGGRLYVYAPIMIGDERVGALEISESLAHEGRYVRSRILRSSLSAGLMAVVSVLLAWLLGRRLVGRPIAGLIDMARRVGRGDFSARLRLPPGNELSELAAEMNAMADQLVEARRKVADETAARIAAIEELRHAERLTTVGKLASGLAHELGTPLNVISGRAEMIHTGECSSPDQVVENARIITKQSGRMASIVRQLLDFARRPSQAKVSQDLAPIARETLELLGPLAAESGVSLRLVLEDVGLRARVDRAQIQQVLTNLVMNAIHATPAGGEITISGALALDPRADAPAARGHVRLQVEDDGSGIPQRALPRLFDPFFTLKPKGEGTGLGLSVAHGIVQEHGGWIEVRSELEMGSRFTVWLPGEADAR